MIQVVTRRMVIREARQRWLQVYKDDPVDWEIGKPGELKSVGAIRAALEALDIEVCTIADLDEAIGGAGWANNQCDECDRDQETVVQLSRKPSFGDDGRWIKLCLDCLDRARSLLGALESRAWVKEKL